MNKKIIGLFLLLVCCNNSEQNGNDLTSTSITTTTSTLVTEIIDSNSEIKENIIYKTSGINLLFKNKFILNENFNSISDLDSVNINNEKFYLITMTYAKKIIMVDKDFNYVKDFLDFSNLALSSNTGSESGLINMEIIELNEGYQAVFVTYIDLKSRLTLHQFILKDFNEEVSQKIVFQGNQNRRPEHYGGSIYNEDNKYIYLSVGDHSIIDETIANNFTPESKIHRYLINYENEEVNLTTAGIDFNPLYKQRNEMNVSILKSIFLSGFRNPWNFTVINSKEEEKIYIVGDVGQSNYEEINIIYESELYTSPYFGWPFFEGPFFSQYFDEVNTEVLQSHRAPDFYYEHKENDSGGFRCAIILGGVFSSKYDFQDNSFIFTDWCSAELFSLKINNGKYEFFVYEDVELIDYEGENINPNIIKTLENNTFLMTVNGEVFQLIDK
jgi:hypothetical protein